MRLPVVPRMPLPPTPLQIARNLPRILIKPVSYTPFILQRLLVEAALGHAFQEAIQDGDFDFLQGKYLQVEIRDVKLCWYFSFNGRRLLVTRHARADATISGELREFLLLASRQEDPDTLFFQRRLQINGDTELGLEVKNMLDTIDLDNLPKPLRLARRAALTAARKVKVELSPTSCGDEVSD